MKTVELMGQCRLITVGCDGPEIQVSEKQLRQFELDAIKEGMTLAVGICVELAQERDIVCAATCCDSIEVARDAMKEI